MLKKKDFLCQSPFIYSEVYDYSQYLCCPSWLPVEVSGNVSHKTINNSFYNKTSDKIRESILDGSYKYCDEKQCPALAGLKSNKIANTFLKNTPENRKWLKENTKLRVINFCFDRSCNLQCPSCRHELINYLGKDRQQVEDKLKEVNEEIGQDIERLYLSGTADPFYSKSFRQFLINLQHDNFPNLKSIHLHTNANLWTEKLWNKMEAVHPYVNSCEISIDAATKETYENIVRLGGDWDKLLENLKFIIQIPTIKEYRFSFVVQKDNYKEMLDFHKLMKSYIDTREDKVIFQILYNTISQWGHMTKEEHIEKDVSNPNHIEHLDFLHELEKIKDLPYFLSNFNHLYKVKPKFI